ncbi:hypothetical protein MKX03_027905 [Papaver bracteatum]|nr:hypothetical protein MKX03_027905 [Papaver bracteatum]
MYNVVLCMPGGSKLFVGARVITDRESGRSMGFNLSAAAVKRMLVKLLLWTVRCLPGCGGGYNNGGGGYGDGRRNDGF